MKSVTFPKKQPFDAVTGDLLPNYRDAYLLGQLTPVPAQQIEAYLGRNSIQKSVLLGRYHELSATATAAGRTLVPPRWVQLQLQRQASTSAAGPWRRPVVRLAAGILLALCLASGVQWLRNEPLVPAPVAAAVVRVAASASQATQDLVQRFTAPKSSPAETNAAAPARLSTKRKETTRLQPQHPAAIPEPAPPALAEPVAEASPVDSVHAALLSPAAKNAPLMQTVRGHVSGAEGQPLAGATVLVPGTQLVTTTNATGDYTLSVPAGTELKFGYAGFTDEVLRTSSTTVSSTHNVVLTPEDGPTKRLRHR